MKIIYCHNRNIEPNTLEVTNVCHKFKEVSLSRVVNPRGGTTVAMESIQSWLLDNLSQGDQIVRKLGIARCSKDDNYNKKTGRELAFSRLKTKLLTVVNIVKLGPNVTVFFEDEDENLFEVKKSADPNCAILVRLLDD